MRVKNQYRMISIAAAISLFLPTLLKYFDAFTKGVDLLIAAMLWTCPALTCYLIFGILFSKEELDKDILRILSGISMVMSFGKLVTLIDYRSYIRLFLHGYSLNKEVVVIFAHSLCWLVTAVMFFICSSELSLRKIDFLSIIWIVPSVIYFVTDFVFIFFFRMTVKWNYEPLNIVSFISFPIGYFCIGFWMKKTVIDRYRRFYLV